MGLKQLPNSLSPEELLKLLETATDHPQVTEGKTDIVAFLSAFNIRPGPTLIKRTLLYDLYRAWSTNPVKSGVFSLEMLKFLENYPTGTGTCYLLNQEAFNLSERAFKLYSKDKKDRSKSPRHKAHYDNFMSKYNLKPGTYWIEGYYLFYLYDKWCFSIKKPRRMRYGNFMRMSMLYFKHKRRTSSRMEWLAVDKEILNHFTKNEMKEIKEGHDKKYEKRQEKTDKTLSRKVSSITTSTKS